MTSPFAQILTDTYLADPCGVQPNALWKTLKSLDRFEVEFEARGDQATFVRLSSDNTIHTLWGHRHTPRPLNEEVPAGTEMMILRDSFLSYASQRHFDKTERYFRLRHGLASTPVTEAPEGLRVVQALPATESGEVAEFINSCYEDIGVSSGEVRSWAETPVFDPDLWVWVCDAVGTPVGLGIAELDKTIGEGSLEWIQVAPAAQGKGVGRLVVDELLARLRSRARFATVSGDVGAGAPERLYRSRGFTGSDVWHVMRRSKTPT